MICRQLKIYLNLRVEAIS